MLRIREGGRLTVPRHAVLFVWIALLMAIVSQPAISAAESKSKDAFINEILDKVTFIYSRNPEPAIIGKTFKVTIKDFSVDDDETYLIVEGIARTYVYQEPTDDFGGSLSRGV